MSPSSRPGPLLWARSYATDCLTDMATDENADNRQVVVDSCRSEMQGVMSEHGDTERQVRDLASSLRTALLGAASLEAGALGVGSLVAASMLDWSGVAFAGALGISGLWVLPLQKAVLRRRFKEQVQRLRDEMRVAVEKHATGALDTSVQRIRDSVQPYSNFGKSYDVPT